MSARGTEKKVEPPLTRACGRSVNNHKRLGDCILTARTAAMGMAAFMKTVQREREMDLLLPREW